MKYFETGFRFQASHITYEDEDFVDKYAIVLCKGNLKMIGYVIGSFTNPGKMILNYKRKKRPHDLKIKRIENLRKSFIYKHSRLVKNTIQEKWVYNAIIICPNYNKIFYTDESKLEFLRKRLRI